MRKVDFVALISVAALAATLFIALVPASADAKRRPDAPSAKAVKRSLQGLVNSTPFPAGRAAARQALGAFKRKKQCRASDAVLTHRKQVAKSPFQKEVPRNRQRTNNA